MIKKIIFIGLSLVLVSCIGKTQEENSLLKTQVVSLKKQNEILQRNIDDVSAIMAKTSTAPTVTYTPTPEAKKTPTVVDISGTGAIRGSLSYPSEEIPSNLKTCAKNATTGRETCTDEHINGSSFTYGIGYELRVAPGNYAVYSYIPDNKDFKGFYTDRAICEGNECNNHNFDILEVVVEEGKTLNRIDTSDWGVEEPFM